MSTCSRIEETARRNPSGVRFKEACKLAECHRFVLVRIKGSHHIYRNPRFPDAMLNLQPAHDGNAKAYQVRLLLAFIDDVGPVVYRA